MKSFLKAMVLSICTGLLFILDFSVSPEFPPRLGIGLVPEAQAVFGVRRRAVRRGVVIGSSMAATSAATATAASASSEAAQAEAAQAEAASAQASAAAASAQASAAAASSQTVSPAANSGEPLPLGTVVTTLPNNCTSTPVGGVNYYYCSGNFYRVMFQGDQLVYVTAKP